MADAKQLEGKEDKFLFKGKNLECKNELLGGFGFLYGGYWYDKDLNVDQPMSGRMKKKAAIRRIHKNDVLDGWEDTSKKFMKSPSVFLLQIFACEKGKDDWRYFAIEPYSSTLYHYCNGQYNGPSLPSEPQVINQMIGGINFLHNMKYAHGDLNPLNVIISQDQRIKLSDFGLSKFSYTKSPSNDLSIKIPEICKRKYWLRVRADDTELIADPLEDVYPTEKDDIYAAGCLIFYFLTKGLHPFGDPESIEKNVKKKNPINLTKMKGEHAQMYKEPIENMIRQPKNQLKWWREAIFKFEDALLLKIDRTKSLGEGCYGKVYEGKYEGVPVAVKEISKTPSVTRLIETEIKEHIKLDHDNVLKLLQVSDSNDHRHWHLVLELCAGTLKDYCENKYKGLMPTDGIVLYQIANGVNYIHSRNLFHRDIKPANILFSITQPVQMKVADLGLVKQITDEGLCSETEIRGSVLYSAPELLEKSESTTDSDGLVKADTFSTGCVFFYFLTRGFHPFHDGKKVDIGNWAQVKEKMKRNEPIGLESRKKSLQPPFYDLISQMIAPKEERIELPEVIKILATELSATRGFKEVVNPIVSECWSFCFHPTEPVLACGGEKLFFLSAANSSIPFSNWKQKSETEIQRGSYFFIYDLKWNVDGTQLVVVGRDNRYVFFVKVLSYPSCEILFEKDFPGSFDSLEWNHFRPNVFAVTSHTASYRFDMNRYKVFLFHFYPDDKQKCQSYAIQQEKTIVNVQWISKDQIALGSSNGRVEIYEMDESDFVFRLFKRYDHLKLIFPRPFLPTFVWGERTKCFAAVCDGRKSLKIWPMESDEPIYSLEIDVRIESFAWRPNGKKRDDEEMDAARKSSSNFILVCGLDDGNILMWTPLEEKEKKILSGHSSDVHFLSFSPDGKFLASGDADEKLIIWSTETWNPVFIGKKNIFPSSLSWMPSSADNPEYKFICSNGDRKLTALEYAVGQTATSIEESENIPSEVEDRQSEKRETRGQWSIGSSGDLK